MGKQEVEREFTQYRKKTEATIKTCKEELTKQKKEAEENIKKCKEETEYEKSLKLKAMIENHSIKEFAEEIELKNDNLRKEYEVLSRNHEEEVRIIRRNHENDIKREKSIIDDTTLKVQ